MAIEHLDDQQPRTRSLITLTEAAVTHVQALLARQGKEGHCLRISVAGGGCSGLSYKLGTEEAPAPTDKVLIFGALRVLIDLKSSLYLAGMELDYSDDLMNAGWQFRNPNAKTTCGCGESFSA